jgi:predicted transcriptional regulator
MPPKFTAEKLIKSAQLASDLFEHKTVDESAESLNEIARKVGLSRSTAGERVRKNVRAGLLEKVWKTSNGKLIPAYRIKK